MKRGGSGATGHRQTSELPHALNVSDMLVAKKKKVAKEANKQLSIRRRHQR